MRRWLRLIPVVLMGSLAVAYVLARPGLQARVPHLAILEFPIGAAIVALLLWAALASRRRVEPLVPWRKHAQIVRELPDPTLARDLAVLDAWVERGDGPDAAADVLARASAVDPHEQESAREALLQELSKRPSRRKREELLTKHIEGV